jgi:hypothetical protein
MACRSFGDVRVEANMAHRVETPRTKRREEGDEP